MKIPDAIVQLILEYDKEPYFINCGECDIFADRIIDRAGMGEFVWLDEHPLVCVAHAVVYHDGKYYDAECPQGVSDPRQLPFVANKGNKEYHQKMQKCS